MSVAVESLFTSALGLQAPWVVSKINLDTSRRRIDCELDCTAKKAACPHCHAPPAKAFMTGLAQISYDRFHVVAMTNEAMNGVRREEVKAQPQAVEEVFGDNKPKLDEWKDAAPDPTEYPSAHS